MTYGDDRTAGAMGDDERRDYVRQDGAAMAAPPDGPSRDLPDEFQRLQQLYGKFCGPMSEAVLKARWAQIDPNDSLTWEMRRAKSTGLAYMEQELIETFAAIEAAGYVVVPADRE